MIHNDNRNILFLSETNILLKYKITYKLYTEIIKDYNKLFISHTWRRD
jgi:hypothetical protein